MSTGGYSRRHTRSSGSKDFSINSIARPTPPPTTLTPEYTDAEFEPCAATASFLLYAQRNVVLVLHHDTLAIERRFDLHREDVSWIVTDNASERGSGRLAVSYDTGNTAIVWDILNGGEVARFSAYEHIKTASFMRNGNIAFGNDQGNIILFEPSTSEHIAARTIFDPITSLAPSSDCRTFAIGYLNGSILIATLQPSFTILHTLTTSRAPSRITGLAWHGSSSKQKTDMLATQTQDGDLRVWSVPKGSVQESPNIIRVLQRAEIAQQGPCWFAWSKNGRIVQYAEGETRSWDVRTKKVSWDIIPTVDGVTGIAIYGPSATLFTLSRNHFVQQYDITPNTTPLQVASVQHPPSNTPPTPPTLLDEQGSTVSLDPSTFTDTAGESSADEGAAMSPLNKIAREMDSLDALESELRDKVMPLSPTSSRGSSVSSRSSGARRRGRKYLYDRPDSSRASSTSDYEGTEFSLGTPSYRPGHESMSIRSVSSFASASNSRYRPTNLRKEIMRSPNEAHQTATMNLFPYTTKRLRDVPFRTPHYGNVARTPELLQREMLSVIFGWHDTARALVRDELSRHKAGSASGVILSKWLGDVGADDMASMVGSESMSSSDWMLLALSAIGSESQKKVGEAFVQRLLEKGDIHPAAAILLGLGENNDAIEVYVSQHYWLEAVILTCLTCPADWGRISYLIRKWGEAEVQRGQAELAVRCFSCTSVETSEPWFSPRAQDAVYAAQQERLTAPLSAGGMTSPPLSPPSRSGSGKLSQKNASLKLITTFGPKGVPVETELHDPTPMPGTGITPIAQSALSPTAAGESWQSRTRKMRDPSSARTATPGGFSRRKRLPSRSEIERAKQEAANMATPLTAAREVPPPMPYTSSRRTSSVGSMQEPTTALKERLAPGVVTEDGHLPSPAQGVFTRLRAESLQRNASRERKPDGLAVHVMETRYTGGANSPAPSTEASVRSIKTGTSRTGIEPPPLTGESVKSAKARAIDDYISSVESARDLAREKRAQSKKRAESRKREESLGGRARSRPREASTARSDRYIQPAKRSPSSPVPMSPDEIAQASNDGKVEPATTDDENFYKITSPVESHKSIRSFRSEPKPERRRPSLGPNGEVVAAPSARSRARSRPRSPDANLSVDDDRGRGNQRTIGSAARSPSSPLPMLEGSAYVDLDETNSDGRRIRSRASSRADETLQGRRAESRGGRTRSSSRKPLVNDEAMELLPAVSMLKGSAANSSVAGSNLSSTSESYTYRARGLTRKEIAAKELEERRLSLARRPSAPAIPLPSDLPSGGSMRPTIGQRSHTEFGTSPTLPPYSRSQTVDPEAMLRYGRITGTSTPSAPIGLPATPRAMRHPKYMTADPNERDDAPPVPEIPDNVSALSSLGSSLSQVTGSALGSHLGSNLDSNVGSNLTSNLTSNMSSDLSRVKGVEADDSIAPLLPATVFGQKPSMAPSRSASAPPEKMAAGVHPMYKPTLPHSNRRVSHVRKISPPDAQLPPSNPGAVSSIDETLAATNDQQIVFIPEDLEGPPPMLPELQHLAGPPPPPPPPTMYAQQSSGQGNGSSIVSFGADDTTPLSAVEPPSMLPQTTYPYAMDRAATVSPSAHRRGRGSVSETIGSRFRGFGDRMRSTSRNRTKSPLQDPNYRPYETVLPPMPSLSRQDSIVRAKSPYEQAMAAQGVASYDHIPPPPPPPPAPPVPGYETKLQETTIPPSSLPATSRSQSAMGYRNPKEIRANMPPETLQQGVYQGGFL